MEIISMGIIKTTIFFLILLYASIKDIKTREVPDYVPIMICITALINNSVQNIPYMIIGAILISIPQVVIAAKNPGTYGGADIKIVAACTFYLGIKGGLFILVIGISFTILKEYFLKRSIYKKHKSAGEALIPYYALSVFSYFTLNNMI